MNRKTDPSENRKENSDNETDKQIATVYQYLCSDMDKRMPYVSSEDYQQLIETYPTLGSIQKVEKLMNLE